MMVNAYADVPYPSLRAVQSILDKIAEQEPQAAKGREAKSFVDDSLVKGVEDSGLTGSCMDDDRLEDPWHESRGV